MSRRPRTPPSPPCPSLAVSPTRAPAPAAGREKDGPGHAHTRLSDVQDLAEDQGELDAASSEGALVLVFPAAVLEDELEERTGASHYVGHRPRRLPQRWGSGTPRSSCIPE